MANPTPVHLKKFRKSSGLTQHEVAFLVGMNSGQIISRHESMARVPDLHTLFAYQVLFNVTAHEMFPGVFADAEQLVMLRLRQMATRFEKACATPAAAWKHKVIRQAIARLSAGPHTDHL